VYSRTQGFVVFSESFDDRDCFFRDNSNAVIYWFRAVREIG